MRSLLKNEKFFLLLLFGLACFFRMFLLESLPATFFVDEVLSGYLGRYMILNHMDLFGNPYPWLYFNKFGDYYIVAPMYLDGLSTFIFGVTRFATRFPTAIIGALAVFPVFWLTTKIYAKKSVGLLAVLLVAILPWYVVLARATTESVIELTVVLCVVCALLVTTENKQRLKWLLVAFLLSLLSYLIYHTARILVPLIWIGYTVLFFDKLRVNRSLITGTVVCTIALFLITIGISQTEWGKGRFNQTSIFSVQSGVSIKMTEMTYNLGSDSVLLARVFHNKIVGYSREFITQYLNYLNPLFLFTDQAWLNTRYGVPESGPVYLTILLMILSLLVPVRSKYVINRKAMYLVIWILLIAPLPAALTVIESPNVRRSILLGIPLLIIAAYGWHRSFSISWRKFKLGYLITLFLSIEVIFFIYHYVKQSDMYNSLYRTDGQAEIVAYLRTQSPANKYIITDSLEFPLYYLFATKDFSAEYAGRFKPELRIDSLGNTQPRQELCAVDLPTDVVTALSEQDQVIEPERCQLDTCRFTSIDTITGVNHLIKFRVLKPNVISGQHPVCN